MRRLIDIPTLETLAFVRTALAAGPRRVLEIGCGTGELALALARLGHDVTALDADTAAVRAALSLGVDARHAVWPDFDDRPYDAVLFTRSLHHLRPLPAALDRARALLRPGGSVLVEDFAFSETSPRTITWFHDLVGRLARTDLWQPAPDSFVAKLCGAADPVAAWHDEHEHELHPAAVMSAELAARFDVSPPSTAPYLYRYLVSALVDSAPGTEQLARVLADEKALIGRDAIDAVGRRFIARVEPLRAP